MEPATAPRPDMAPELTPEEEQDCRLIEGRPVSFIFLTPVYVHGSDFEANLVLTRLCWAWLHVYLNQNWGGRGKYLDLCEFEASLVYM
ncbi:hypothetical protein STEG23_031305, partial [Scotinomys teguina]